MYPTGGSSIALVVANLYAQRNVRIDRLPDPVKQDLAELDSPFEMGGWRSDLYVTPASGGPEDSAKYYGRRTIADIWLKVKDKERARQALLDVQAMADSSKPKPDPKDPQQAAKQRTYLSRQVDYWRRMGDLAQMEGHKTDAMTFYQNALLARTTPPASGQKDELGEKARALWTDIGGSNEGWQAWFTRKDLLGVAAPEAPAATLAKIEKTLPDFELADLSGARWRLADFKGKATLVGIWATR